MTTETPEQGLAPKLVAYSSILAPLTIAFTGTIYLSGYSWKRRVLSAFGLEPGMFSESLQETLARGYLSTLVGVIVIGIALGIIWLLDTQTRVFYERTRAKSLEVDKKLNIFIRINDIMSKISKWVVYCVTAFAVLTLGAASGSAVGAWQAGTIIDDVESGCSEGCVEYRAGIPERRMVGRIIEADSNRIAIYTLHGTVLVETAQLRGAFPYSPAARAPIAPANRNAAENKGMDQRR